MPENLDCIIVGYHSQRIEQVLAMTEPAKNQSGAYKHFLANSVRFEGHRAGYFEVINASISRARGVESKLHFGHIPNLAAHTLANFLQNRSFRAEIVNFFDAEKEWFSALLEQSPGVVAITTTFYVDHTPIKEIVDFVRGRNPDVKIVVGGPRMFHFFTDFPEDAQEPLLLDIGADIYVFDMQGELALSRICEEIGKTEQPDFSRVPNLIYRDGSRFVRSPRQPEENSLDADPLEWGRFLANPRCRTVAVRTARGCAFRCAFCRYHVLCKEHTLAGVGTVEKELRQISEAGIGKVLFVDDTFNIPQDRFKELCRTMIRDEFPFRWYCYFRCANADEECFDLMAQAGCEGVFLGIESGDDSVLRQMNKGAHAKRYLQGIQRLHERGILTYATFVVGFPGETDATIRNTIAFIQQARPVFYSVEPYYHDPKVPIAERAAEFGLKGRGYSWRHHTMSWQQATEWSKHAYQTIKDSIVLPLNDFDLWSVGYLLGEGVERDRLIASLRVMSEMVVLGLDESKADFKGHEQKLMSLCA